MPIALLSLGWLPLLLGACINRFGHRDIDWVEAPFYLFSLANMPLFWHVFVQGSQILESSWFVAYMWRPFCVFVNSAWATFVVAIAVEDCVDDGKCLALRAG